MKVRECKEGLPRRQNNKMHDHLMDFMLMKTELGKVELGEHEYASCHVAASVLSIAAKREALPIKVITRKGEVYLKRTDM